MDILILIVVVLLLAVGVFFITIKASDKSCREKQEAEEAQRIKKEQEEKEKQDRRNAITQKYGEVTAEIALGENFLLFFDSSKIALIQDNPVPFNKILSCSLCDNQQMIATTSGEASSSTSTGSMAGRALVGGILLGGVGALAGAATAKKNTEINTTTNYDTKHDYTIYLGLNDMANPQVIIRFGEDADSANKAVSIFGIIINQNTK